MRRIFFWFYVSVVIIYPSVSNTQGSCNENANNTKSLSDINNYLQEKSELYQCVEQEVIDPLVDTWRVQSLAMQLCNKRFKCVQYLRQTTANLSGLSIASFENMQAVQLWGEIYKFSGNARRRAPALSDLPLEQNPEEIFNEIKKAELAKRSLPNNKAKQVFCSAAFMILGPTKMKAAQFVRTLATRKYVVELAHGAEKLLKNNRLPDLVKNKYLKWQSEVEEKGLEEVKKIPGYHDEPIKTRPGQHSVRLNSGYRVFYETFEERGVMHLRVLEISVHEY
jgi:proteic killer suppression protein